MENDLINSNRSNESLYNSVCVVLTNAREKAYRAINFAMVQAYWQIGRLIVEEEQNGNARAEYGKAIIIELSGRLTAEFGKGFDSRELRRMRQFYLLFPKWDAVRPELSWTHYRLLLRVEDKKAREWYINEATAENWSSRQLDRQISALYYERLLLSKEKESVVTEAECKLSKMESEHFIRNPYVLEFLNLKDYPSLRENRLEQALMDNLQAFLLELGKGFSFVARQKRMRYEEHDFYIDLVFYNYILKCFVLIDLKIGELSHQDVGQMDSYVRMYEDILKGKDDNPTIGLILCSKRNETIAKYSVLKESKQIFASKYILQLPTEEELRLEIERERRQIEENQE